MMASSSPATPHVQAAQEFLKNGNRAGAQQALEQISSEHRDRPEVLEIRWELAAQAQEWAAAFSIASLLCQTDPENEVGWLWQSCSLIELKRVPEAFDALLAAQAKFPKSPAVAYNLACCAAKLKRFEEAFQWIVKATEAGGRAEVKLMALSDPDLDPLLDRICALE